VDDKPGSALTSADREPSDFKLDASIWRALAAGPPVHVVVLGAGRWGRILSGVLAELGPPLASVQLVAARNRAAAQEWLAPRHARGELTKVTVASSLEAALARHPVQVAVVARLACDHYATTLQLLERGLHVLTEKPFTATAAEARRLLEVAGGRGLALAVGYEFMYSPSLHRLRAAMRRALGTVQRVRFVWHDCRGVEKWGIRKDPDPSLNVVSDVLPHILSEFVLLFGRAPSTLGMLTTRDGCRDAMLAMRGGDIDIEISLDKHAAAACRSVSVEDAAGHCLVLDYTSEPGWLTLDGERLTDDAQAGDHMPSLNAELSYFIAHTRDPNVKIPNTAAGTLPVVEVTERSEHALVDEQIAMLRPFLYQPLPRTLPPNAVAMLRPHLVGSLLRHRVVDNPKDAAQLDAWVERVLRITHTLSREPWTTQRDVLRAEGLDRERLLHLNAAMRDTDLVQKLIVEVGLAQKYWQTILPLVTSGSIEDVLRDRYGFPVRIGIYAALSCMFHCSFCGREANARYDHAALGNGNAVFDDIFAAMAADGRSTLSLGGGLEPLTNSRIDDVIHGAKSRGLRVPLVTNGYMLTPKYQELHPGLFDLDIFRVSLYGVDDASYQQVTGRKQAFEPVKANVISFLKERNRRGSRTKFGFNFIVLMNTTDQVLRVLDVIRDINSQVDNGPGVDFLTLREDFSVPEEGGLSSAERQALVDIFARFRAKQRNECPRLEVDYGYALHALSEGVMWKPLAMVKAADMYPKVYPQVSVAVDILGDVYLYRDAAFLNRPGADRYIIGRVSPERSLEQVIRGYLETTQGIEPRPDDPALMDAFDHVVSKTVWQGLADIEAGIAFNDGPVRARVFHPDAQSAARLNYWERLDDMRSDA
jgi:dTDP-4-amino-4,6-dideoxy-D-glucose ammonia-lyase